MTDMDIINHPKAWDMLPNETPKAWAAFCIYRDLPPYGERTRSIKTVQSELGLADPSGLFQWSSKYDWVARVQAYDAYKASKSLSIREVAQEDFAKEVIAGTSMRVAMLHKIMDTQLGRIIQKQENDPEMLLDASELKQLTGMAKTLDDLQRRAAGLPTSYTAEIGKDVPEDEKVYVIGSANAQS